jgi:HK97 family phage portal protein
MNLKDSQMLESRQFTVQEICRWFQVSPHLVADLSHATFSNIENLAQQFVTFTLYGWLKRWEENLWRCVLTPKEQEQGYYFQHNLNALQRGNFQARMAGYSTALQNGFMSQNEVRNLEDLNPFEGGDDYHIQLNMQTLPGGEPTASQQAALTKIGTSAKGFHRETQNGFNPTVRH